MRGRVWRPAARFSDRELIGPLVRLADVQRAAEQTEHARASYQRALLLAEAVAPQDEPVLVLPLCSLAELELANGEASSSLRIATRATRIVEQHRAGPRLAGSAQFALARALAATSAPESDVRAAAEAARTSFQTTRDAERRDEVDAWLAAMTTR